jgi:isopenicillin-N N-acyltransferase-like protein
MHKFRSVILLCLLIGCTHPAEPVIPPIASAEPALAVATPQVQTLPFQVIELSGTPAEIGTAHGQALREPITFLYQHYLQRFYRNQAQRLVAMGTARLFSSHVLPEHQAEIHAIAEATGLAPDEVMLGQCFLDLLPMTACSTVALPAASSPDGIPRMGRNLDFPSFNIADKHSVLLIVRPEGKNAFAAVSWPGLVGVLTGMNEHGLTLANMEVDRERRFPTAMPYTLLYRTVLENCRTVAEAITLLENTPRQSANNLMLMDAAGDRAVVEITPESITVRRAAADQPLVSTNHQRADNHDKLGYCTRYDYLYTASIAKSGNVTPQSIQGMLGEASQGKMTLQSMVFEPTTRTLYLAVGAEAPRHPFVRLDLKPYFDR